MKIYGLQKLTLLDYPGKVACTVFTAGCNFSCPFCQNSSLVLGQRPEPLDEEGFFLFLKKRKGILDGVCISGGEPTLAGGLEDFAGRDKDMGYQVKLDTNGSKPELMKKLYDKGLLDYVAMDIKNAPYRYGETAGISREKETALLEKIRESLSWLLEGRLPYEFRTTVCRELHGEQEIGCIGEMIRGASSYYLQNYQDGEGVLCPGLSSFSREELENYREILRQYGIGNIGIRGI